MSKVIIVNGRDHHVDQESISFLEVLKLANVSNEMAAVSWRKGAVENGTMMNGMSIPLRDGLVFSVEVPEFSQ